MNTAPRSKVRNAGATLAGIGASLIILSAEATAQRAMTSQAGTATLEGTVLSCPSGRPLSGARVQAVSEDARWFVVPAISNAQGQFLLSRVREGELILGATKAGLHPGQHGQSAPDVPPTPLSVHADARIAGLKVCVWEPGGITGQFLDDAGDPVVGVPIQALKWNWNETALSMELSVNTDDRGRYRLSPLAPGVYLVSAPARGKKATGHPSIFYPSASRPEAALAVHVESGRERSAVDLLSPALKTFRIAGVVRGTPVRDAPLRSSPLVLRLLAAAGPGGFELEMARAPADANGRFAFDDIAPGSYLIRGGDFPKSAGVASASQTAVGWKIPATGSLPPVPSAPTWWTAASVTVGDRDVLTVPIQLARGRTIAGRLQFLGAEEGPSRDALLGTAIIVRPVDGIDIGTFPLSRVEADRTFRTAELPAAAYSLSLDLSRLDGWYLTSVRSGSREVAGSSIDLGSGSIDDIVITLTHQRIDLSGFVRDTTGKVASGAIVLAFPTQREFWSGYGPSSPRIRIVRASTSGSYRFSGLLSGDYYVISVAPEQWVPSWGASSNLARLAAVATRVRVESSTIQDVTIR